MVVGKDMCIIREAKKAMVYVVGAKVTSETRVKDPIWV